MKPESEIRALLLAPDAESRRRGVECLGVSEVEGRASLLVASMADSDWRVRKEAVRVSSSLAPDPSLLAELVELFSQSDDVGQRNAAVEALAAYGESAVGALAHRLDSFDADARKLTAEVLGSSRQAGALPILGRLVLDVDANVRLAAVEAVALLGSVSQDGALDLLSQALSTNDPLLRLAALGGCNLLKFAVPWELSMSLLADPILSSTALVSLGRSGDERSVPVLVQELALEQAGSSALALLALGELSLSSSAAQLRVQRELETAPRAVAWIMSKANTSVDSQIRKAAILLCGLAPSEKVADLLVTVLSDPEVAAEAETALGTLGELGVGALLRALKTDPSDQAQVLLEVLARLPRQAHSDEATELLGGVLGRGEARTLRGALLAAATHGTAQLLPAILPWLKQEVRGSVRRTAVQSLSDLASRFPEAARRLTTEAERLEPLAWATIVRSLAAPIGADLEVDVSQMRKLLTSEDVALRRAAVEALGALGAPSAIEVVALALTDEEREVQVAAISALGSVRAQNGEAPGTEHLIDLIARTEEDVLLVPALHALGETNDRRALAVLQPFVRSAQPLRALAAIKAITRLEEVRAEALVEALDHAASDVVMLGLEALLALNDPRGPRHLQRCLEHEAREVRRFAADLAGKTRGVDLDVIRTRLRDEQDGVVQTALLQALSEIETRSRRSLAPVKIEELGEP